jgi:hypothetical protein
MCTEHGIELHGVLWIIDELYDYAIEAPAALAAALRLFAQDQTVSLPRRGLLNAIRRCEGCLDSRSGAAVVGSQCRQSSSAASAPVKCWEATT